MFGAQCCRQGPIFGRIDMSPVERIIAPRKAAGYGPSVNTACLHPVMYISNTPMGWRLTSGYLLTEATLQ